MGKILSIMRFYRQPCIRDFRYGEVSDKELGDMCIITQTPKPSQHELEVLKEKVQVLQEENGRLKLEIYQSEATKDDALRRLSEIISVKLRDNNPNIADLNDPYRPTKLAEISSELYDNEWTEAFDVLEKCYSERESITILLYILMNINAYCKKSVESEWNIVTKWHFMDKEVSDANKTRHWLVQSRKENIGRLLPEIQQECFQFLITNTDDKNLRKLLTEDKIVEAYVNTCVKLCLYMSVQDPPCVMFCPGWRSDPIILQGGVSRSGNPNKDAIDTGEPTYEMEASLYVPNINGIGEAGSFNEMVELGNDKKHSHKIKFDKTMLKEYTRSGQYLDFVVWPVLYLHEGGLLLFRGIAQACD